MKLSETQKRAIKAMVAEEGWTYAGGIRNATLAVLERHALVQPGRRFGRAGQYRATKEARDMVAQWNREELGFVPEAPAHISYVPDYVGHWRGVAWFSHHTYGIQVHRDIHDALRWCEGRDDLVEAAPAKAATGQLGTHEQITELFEQAKSLGYCDDGAWRVSQQAWWVEGAPCGDECEIHVGIRRYSDTGECEACEIVRKVADEAATLRAEAAQHDRDAQESFERCDTDGFLSQWASGVTAQQKRLQARIVDNGGTWTFPALFDLEGNLIAAKLIETQYGWSWGILESDDPRSRVVRWVSLSNARKPETERRNNAKKGFYLGTVQAPATADLAGATAVSVTAYARRTDGGFSRDVVIVDNGQPGPKKEPRRVPAGEMPVLQSLLRL